MLHLERINRVYRFSIHERSWSRASGAADHCLAYKLYGRTVHIHDGREYVHDQDSVMIGKDDLYRVVSHDPEDAGARGGCIAGHFETVEPFDLPMACVGVASDPHIKSGFFRLLDAWNRLQRGGGASDEYACAALFYTRRFRNSKKDGKLYSVITVLLAIMAGIYGGMGLLGLLTYFGIV